MARAEKNGAEIFEDENPQKPVPQVEKVDYSGAHEKTDPKEIALVKKLDRWIMVSVLFVDARALELCTNEKLQPMLWSMYWLNYLDRNAIALARLNDLEEDLNLTSTGIAATPGPKCSSFVMEYAYTRVFFFRIPNLCIHSLRRLHHRTSAIQHVSHTHSPKSLHGKAIFCHLDTLRTWPSNHCSLNRES